MSFGIEAERDFYLESASERVQIIKTILIKYYCNKL